MDETYMTKDFDFDTFNESLESTGYFYTDNSGKKKYILGRHKEYYVMEDVKNEI